MSTPISVEPVYTFVLPPGESTVTLDNSNITGTLTTFADGATVLVPVAKAAPKKKLDTKDFKKKKIVWYPASHFY